jgi:hypothetical protein
MRKGKASPFTKSISKGMITLTHKNGSVLTFTGATFDDAKKDLRAHFATGTTAKAQLDKEIGKDSINVIAGYSHKGLNDINVKKFNGNA